MAPPLSVSQKKLLNELYYDKGLRVGRDKLYQYIRANHKDSKISRRQVYDYLTKQESYQLYSNRQNVSQIQTTIHTKPRSALMIDLVDFGNFETREGYRYLLTAIDTYTRYAWVLPLKTKKNKEVLNRFKDIINSMDKYPSTIRSDNGSEFINKNFKSYCKKEGMIQIFGKPHSPWSQGAIESFNATISKMLVRTMEDETRDWVVLLESAVENYNSLIHTSTGITPKQAESGISIDARKQKKELKNIRKDHEVGSNVRIQINKAYKHGKSPNFTREVYEIVAKTKPRKVTTATRYKLKNKEGTVLKKIYFGDELMVIPKGTKSKRSSAAPLDRISKLLEYDPKRKGREIHVRWVRKKGQPTEYTYESVQTILEDVPKILRRDLPDVYNKFVKNIPIPQKKTIKRATKAKQSANYGKTYKTTKSDRRKR